MELIHIERKSAVLTPSTLACLSRTATVNLTAGCAHECLYCYTRGFSNHPGPGKVAIYTNTLEKIRKELPRKRKKPRSVYFSPASDAFQPIQEVLDFSYEAMKYLLEHDVRVAVLTKGTIPDRHMRLFEKHAEKVAVQVGIITPRDDLAAVFEPNAASVPQRLGQLAGLIHAGVRVRARLDPILPGLTDDAESLNDLLSQIAATGAKDIVLAILYLRPVVRAYLRHRLPSASMAEALLQRYEGQPRTPIQAANSTVIALPRDERIRMLDNAETIASRYGLRCHICACKNPDLPGKPCGIAGVWPEDHGTAPEFLLFPPRRPPEHDANNRTEQTAAASPEQ